MWVSPRKCDEVARRAAARNADEAEEVLGRRLTPKELGQVYRETRETYQAMGRRARAAAGK